MTIGNRKQIIHKLCKTRSRTALTQPHEVEEMYRDLSCTVSNENSSKGAETSRNGERLPVNQIIIQKSNEYHLQRMSSRTAALDQKPEYAPTDSKHIYRTENVTHDYLLSNLSQRTKQSFFSLGKTTRSLSKAKENQHQQISSIKDYYTNLRKDLGLQYVAQRPGTTFHESHHPLLLHRHSNSTYIKPAKKHALKPNTTSILFKQFVESGPEMRAGAKVRLAVDALKKNGNSQRSVDLKVVKKLMKNIEK